MMKPNPEKLCRCCIAARNVFNDLLIAMDRLRIWDDSNVEMYMTGYKNGLRNAKERLEITCLNYCPEKGDSEKQNPQGA